MNEELLKAVFDGTVKKQGRGRPKKGSTAVTWKQIGIKRQEVHEFRKLARIPEELAQTFMDQRRAEGKNLSRRSVLIHFGLKNVGGDDVFVGTAIGELAEQLLEPLERQLRKVFVNGTGSAAIWENDTIFGKTALTSTSVPSNLTKGSSVGVCHALIFGCFSELILAEFGVMEVTVDYWSRKKQQLIELTSISFVDVVLPRPSAFSVALDVTVS